MAVQCSMFRESRVVQTPGGFPSHVFTCIRIWGVECSECTVLRYLVLRATVRSTDTSG